MNDTAHTLALRISEQWMNLPWYSDGASTREFRNVHQCLNFSCFRWKNQSLAEGQLYWWGRVVSPNHSTWQSSTCENLVNCCCIKLFQQNSCNTCCRWIKQTELENFPRNILMMEVMVECLGMNWSKEELSYKKGEVGDGGRIAGQSSNPSRRASLPSASLNRWPVTTPEESMTARPNAVHSLK